MGQSIPHTKPQRCLERGRSHVTMERDSWIGQSDCRETLRNGLQPYILWLADFCELTDNDASYTQCRRAFFAVTSSSNHLPLTVNYGVAHIVHCRLTMFAGDLKSPSAVIQNISLAARFYTQILIRFGFCTAVLSRNISLFS